MKTSRLITIISLLLFIQCNKNKDVAPLGPGIFLSSDMPAHNWYFFKNFLKENHFKVTFYIASFQLLTEEEKRLTREMMADGHEIAHHTASHPDINVYLETHSLDEYMNTEIIPMKNQMEAEGFPCYTFAYPKGTSTNASDSRLLSYFYSVRKTYNSYLLKKPEDLDAIYYRYGDNELLNAASIDQKTKISINEIFAAMEKAKKSKQTVSFYCHNIAVSGATYDELSIKESDLKELISKANQLGLKSYTASEISKSK